MSKQPIELPDVLPSRYQSWLEVYLHAIKAFEGREYNDSTEVSLVQMGYHHHDLKGEVKETEELTLFANTWPLHVLKSRALDYVLENIPSPKMMANIRHATFMNFSATRQEDMSKVLSNLMDLAVQKDKFK